MNWTMPQNTVAQTDYFNNSDEGHRALYQNLSDYFTNSGSNSFMSNWFNQQYGSQMNRFNTDASANPALNFSDWLQNKAPELANAYNLLPSSMQGGYAGFSRNSSEKW